MEFFELCKKIGIETFGDLERFNKEERRVGETTLQCLNRYYNELGKDFKIKE